MGTPAEGKLRLVVFHTTSACTGRRAEVPGASARLCVCVVWVGWGGVGGGGVVVGGESDCWWRVSGWSEISVCVRECCAGARGSARARKRVWVRLCVRVRALGPVLAPVCEREGG
jgi:hypothetical protein